MLDSQQLGVGLAGALLTPQEAGLLTESRECSLRAGRSGQRDFSLEVLALPELGLYVWGRQWVQRVGLIRLILSLPVLKSGLYVVTTFPPVNDKTEVLKGCSLKTSVCLTGVAPWPDSTYPEALCVFLFFVLSRPFCHLIYSFRTRAFQGPRSPH